jgi:hypothetical protein
MLLLLAAQAAESVPTQKPAEIEPFAPIDFDLRKVPPTPARDEIVVIARRNDQRLPPLTAFRQEEALPRAEKGIIGNVRGGVALDKQELPGGVVSNRVMMKLKLPF